MLPLHALPLPCVVYHSLIKWVIKMLLSSHLHLPLQHYPANHKQFEKKPTVFVLALLLPFVVILRQDFPFALFHLKGCQLLFATKKLKLLSTDLPFYFREQISCEYLYNVVLLLTSFLSSPLL